MKKFILDGTKGIFSNYLKGWFEEYYREPTRKGIPKGERIGFSKTKFRATLWSLTSIEIKKQAEILNVSYGVLRKWRTEEQFAWQVKLHTQSFIRSLLEHLERRARDKWENLYGKYSEEETVFYKTIIDPELKKDFGDIEFYNPDLTLAIYNRLANLDLREP